MKSRYWSLAIVLILINYLIFASLFTMLTESDFTRNNTIRQAAPTFTPAPAQPIITVPTPTPVTPQPTPTPTPVVQSQSGKGITGDVIQANSIQESQPVAELVSPGTVNIRSGPGLNFEVLGSLSPHTPMSIIGRTSDGAWWKIRITDDQTGWVANSVVKTSNTIDVPIVTDIP